MVNVIEDFVRAYLIDIIIVLVFIITLIYLYKKGKKDTVKKIILALVVQAEKNLGSKTGKLKYAFVVERVYDVLPFVVRILITRKELDNMIEEAVNYLKEYLTGERDLLGYEEELKVKKFNGFE
ncbi:MAG: hypothetical protein FH753_07115 [Firmicutes bacterium]|nr:hypothetical protein [Bacillota bacterium]